jgi:hypothetical protein
MKGKRKKWADEIDTTVYMDREDEVPVSRKGW